MTEHWRLEIDRERLAWLHFDQVDSPVNTLSEETLAGLERQLDTLEEASPLRGLVLLSDKRGGFIAGADVKQFRELDDPERVQRLIRRAHGLLARLQALPLPTLALIHGHCLGGGLELALACDYRVAADDAGTRLGFPEVRLGIFPGFGGSGRSIRLLGPLQALPLMLGGRSLDARAARRIGLVDLAVPPRQLQRAARRLLRSRPPPRLPSWPIRQLSRWPLRPLLAAVMARRTRQRVDPHHYPAPFRLIDHWCRNGGDPRRMEHGEAREVARLITGRTAQNLIRLFLLQERLKSEAADDGDPVARVHVVGGGTMGGDIAAWCALRGLRVTLQDRGPEQLRRAIGRAHALFRKHLQEERLVRAAGDRLLPDWRGDGVGRADLVIEAIFEEVEAKRTLFRELEPRLSPRALLATNTSSIPLELLAAGLERPGRLVGLHFFNPVARMRLVELIHDRHTETGALSRAAAFVRRIDRLPLPVRSAPGFLVNRILLPYLLEAVQLLQEGVPPAIVDRAATGFGMPVGPVRLADQVGLDICLAVAEKLQPGHGEPLPALLREKVEAGELGRKSGTGFYRYDDRGRPLGGGGGRGPVDAELADRMIYRLLNESLACLREGLVADADLLDAGVVFGTGFAPFRGGPLRHIRETGPRRCRQRLAELERQHGERFRADAGWDLLSPPDTARQSMAAGDLPPPGHRPAFHL